MLYVYRQGSRLPICTLGEHSIAAALSMTLKADGSLWLVVCRTLEAAACGTLDHLTSDLVADTNAALSGFDYAANGLRRSKMQAQVTWEGQGGREGGGTVTTVHHCL